MSRPTIDQIRGVGDFATLYQWNLHFLRSPGAIAGLITDQGALLNLRCESTTIPKATNTKMPIEIRGHRVHQPGTNEYEGAITLVFNETVDNMVSNVISGWREACAATGTGAHGSRADIEATIMIERLNRQDETIWTYTLYGCFLESYEPGDLGFASEVMKPSITLNYDYFADNV